MEHEELKIPFALARHILREKKHPQMRVWFAVKGVHGSWCKKDGFNASQVASLCDFSSTRTVQYHLDKLLEWNWIGEDEDHYFFRSTTYLCQQYGLYGNTYRGYYFDLEEELTELESVLFMMSVEHIINYRKLAGQTSGSLEQTSSGYSVQDYSPNSLSVRLLSKLIGISINMAHRLKMSCVNIGYLERKRNSRLVLPYEHSYLFDNHYGSLFEFDNATRIRLADELTTFM